MSSQQIVDANGAIHSGQDGRFTGHVQSEADTEQVLPADDAAQLDDLLRGYNGEQMEDEFPDFVDDEQRITRIIDVGCRLPGSGEDVFVAEETDGHTSCIDVMVPVQTATGEMYLTKSIMLYQFDGAEGPGLPTARHYLRVLMEARSQVEASLAALLGS